MPQDHADRADVYARVTDQIIRAIEQGAPQWEMPWRSGDAALHLPRNVASGKPYRGVNVLSLWAESHYFGYSESVWGTFRQWLDLGHPVKRGARASVGVFWKPLDSTERDDREPPAESSPRRMMARAFHLFNCDQVEGYISNIVRQAPPSQRVARAEGFFAAIGADVRHGGNKACYHRSSDHIQMPPFEAFRDALAYYATLGHEITHWTGHKSRLDRDLAGRFGSEAYAAEELVGELGSAFLCADLELATDARPENAAYVESWLRILRGDDRAIFAAASQAQRAVDFMRSFPTAVAAVSKPRAVPEPL